MEKQDEKNFFDDSLLLSLSLETRNSLRQVPWSYFRDYFWSFSQYLLTFIIYYYSWLNYAFGQSILCCAVFGWAVYAISMIGHDACHNAMFYQFPRANILHKLICLVTLDCCGVATTKQWIQEHNKEHHSYPNSNVDTQRLFGDNILSEMWGVHWLVWKYLSTDVVDAILNPLENYYKVPLLLIKLVLLKPSSFPKFIVFLESFVFCVAFFGLVTHSNLLQKKANGWRQKQLVNTCDILPGNWFAEFITGGINSHAVHHLYPHLPRSLHGWMSKKAREQEPEFYRSYDTVSEVIAYLSTRFAPPPLQNCPPTSEYYSEKYENAALFRQGIAHNKMSQTTVDQKTKNKEYSS